MIGPDGEWLGTVEASARFRILDVAGGLVLGAEKDDMDVESLVMYELVGTTATTTMRALVLPTRTYLLDVGGGNDWALVWTLDDLGVQRVESAGGGRRG